MEATIQQKTEEIERESSEADDDKRVAVLWEEVEQIRLDELSAAPAPDPSSLLLPLANTPASLSQGGIC